MIAGELYEIKATDYGKICLHRGVGHKLFAVDGPVVCFFISERPDNASDDARVLYFLWNSNIVYLFERSYYNIKKIEEERS